jgi:mannose-6-phosphate isomerase-like protein (cupin superfamily)
MEIKRLILIAIFSFSMTIIVFSSGKEVPFPIEKQNKQIENSSANREAVQRVSSIKNNKSSRIIKGSSMELIKGRRGYDLAGREISTKHFAFRITEPYNPFRAHKHIQSELWFIVKGNAKVLLEGIEYEVEENDLIILDPWVEHGLSTTSQVTWICVG